MKNLRYIFCLIAATIIMQGCSDDPLGDIQQGAGVLELKYEVDTDIPLTRGVAAQEHEKTLRQVHLLFFDTSAGDSFVAYKAVSPDELKGTLSIDPPANMENDHSYRVLAVGNGDDFLVAGHTSFNEYLSGFSGTYNDAVGQLEVAAASAVTQSKGILPLCGTFVKFDGKTESLFTLKRDASGIPVVEESNSTKFLFKRAICRFDIYNLVGNVLDIRYARVVNDRDHGYLFHDGQAAGKVRPFKTAGDPSDAKSGFCGITEDVEPGVRTTQRLEARLYGFPNIVNTTVVNDKVTTALMIAGYYIDPETGVKDTELTYYRFNLANLGESQVLDRNYCYRATIKGVRRRGEPTEDKAYNSSDPVFIYEIEDDWDATDDNVATDEDGNFLIVNKTHLTFDGDANEADNISLRVSTNPELDWRIEEVDIEGNHNEKFICRKTSPQSILCGPTSVNDTEYLYYGYRRIVATNTETGKTLELQVYLVQLSQRDNVKTLTVEDNVGTFTQKINPRGDIVTLKVVTGSRGNLWEAEDIDNRIINWGEDASFTTHGDNGGLLEIKLPPNISGKTREADIVVKLSGDPGEVLPVTVHVVQDNSDQIIYCTNEPKNGVIRIQCLDLTPGNINGIVHPMPFSVTLADPTLKYKVTSTFDKNRDLCISKDAHVGPHGDIASYVATHPAEGAAETDAEKLKLASLTDMPSGSKFYINPFRMGPGDETITGQIVIEAYDSSAPGKILERREFTVQLYAEPVELNDLIFHIGSYYYIFPDRNVGAKPRVSFDGTTCTATYYDHRTNVKIGSTYPYLNTNLKGLTDLVRTMAAHGYNDAKVSYSKKIDYYYTTWLEDNREVNEFYRMEDAWSVTDIETINEKLKNNAVFSKQRVFIVGDYSKSNGKRVCCWIPRSVDCGLYKHDGFIFLCGDIRTTKTMTKWNDVGYNTVNGKISLYSDIPTAVSTSTRKNNLMVRPVCKLDFTKKADLERVYDIIFTD